MKLKHKAIITLSLVILSIPVIADDILKGVEEALIKRDFTKANSELNNLPKLKGVHPNILKSVVKDTERYLLYYDETKQKLDKCENNINSCSRQISFDEQGQFNSYRNSSIYYSREFRQGIIDDYNKMIDNLNRVNGLIVDSINQRREAKRKEQEAIRKAEQEKQEKIRLANAKKRKQEKELKKKQEEATLRVKKKQEEATLRVYQALQNMDAEEAIVQFETIPQVDKAFKKNFEADIEIDRKAKSKGYKGFSFLDITRVMYLAQKNGNMGDYLNRVIGCSQLRLERCQSFNADLEVLQILDDAVLYNFSKFVDGEHVSYTVITDKDPNKIYLENQSIDNGFYVFTGMFSYTNPLGQKKSIPKLKKVNFDQ